jgi:hypothetical protein
MVGRIGKVFLLVAAIALVAAAMVVAQDRNVPKSLVRFTNGNLVKIGQDATLVSLVEAQNAKRVSLAKIQDIDKQWIAEKGINAFMSGLLGNSASARLKSLLAQYDFILEAFVMDNQGALVGLTNKTSDYWQGDEAKFTESYKGGTGAIHYGEPEFDDSANATVVQISVPVTKGGRAIGAITFGVSIEGWEKR